MTLAKILKSSEEVLVVLRSVLLQIIKAGEDHAAEVAEIPRAERRVGVDIILATFNIFDSEVRVYFLEKF